MKKFKLVDRFSGYSNKKDATNIGSTFMIAGSKNVFINDGEKVAVRPGFTLFGAENATLEPIESGHVFRTSRGLEIPMRSYDDNLEYYYDGAWRLLSSGWSSVAFSFTPEAWWDNTEKAGLQIFVNGTPNLYAWNGAIAEIDSTTANTITKTGTTTWAEEGFFVSGNKTVVINGTEYAYTGGESTTTLTGVTPDPTGEADGSIVIQKVITTANQPSATLDNDIVTILNNQIYVAATDQHLVWVSKALDYKDFTGSTPREVGDGEVLTLEGPITAMYAQEKDVYVSAGNDLWYQTVFTSAADLLSETLTIDRLKTGPQQAALSQSSTGKIKNDILFLSKEPTLDTLGRIIDTEKPQSIPISDEIKTLMDSLDITQNPHMIYYKYKSYITFPSSSIVLVYDWEHKFWNPPWTMGISKFFIYNDELYGHSSRVTETYKLLDGKSDNDQPIEAVAKFAYRNYGNRTQQKEFDEYYIEGYISGNTIIDMEFLSDYEGATGVTKKSIDATDQTILFQPSQDVSLGKASLGKEPLGSSVLSLEDKIKFRVIKTVAKQDFYEHSVIFSSNETDSEWELLAHGPNATYSTVDNIHIKQ